VGKKSTTRIIIELKVLKAWFAKDARLQCKKVASLMVAEEKNLQNLQ
jgi:hypothetical protein